jgi:hypothetical protein
VSSKKGEKLSILSEQLLTRRAAEDEKSLIFILSAELHLNNINIEQFRWKFHFFFN